MKWTYGNGFGQYAFDNTSSADEDYSLFYENKVLNWKIKLLDSV